MIIEVRATGRKSFLHLGREDLGTGTILAVFQFWGTICVLTDSWKRWVNIGANCLRQDLSNMPQMLSGPLAFLALILLSALSTSSKLIIISGSCLARRVAFSSFCSLLKSWVSNLA